MNSRPGLQPLNPADSLQNGLRFAGWKVARFTPTLVIAMVVAVVLFYIFRPIVPPMIEVQLFGGLRLVRNGREFNEWRSERARALMAYLLLHPDRDIPREQLAESIWFDHDPLQGRPLWDPDNGRRYLSRELHEITKVLGQDCLQCSKRFVRLNSRCFQIDLARFRGLLDRAHNTPNPEDKRRLLEDATRIVRERGPILPEFYDEWAVERRHQVEAQYHEAVQALEGLQGKRANGQDRLADLTSLEADAFAEFVNSVSDKEKDWLRQLTSEVQRSIYLAEWESRQNSIPRILVNEKVRATWRDPHLAGHVLEMLRSNLDIKRCVPEVPRPYVQSIAGSLAGVIGDNNLAERYLSAALAEFRKRKDMGCVAGTLANLSSIAYEQNNNEVEIRIKSEAVSAYRALGRDECVAGLLIHLALAKSKAGIPYAAIKDLYEALQIARGLADKSLEVKCRETAAQCMAWSGRFPDAEEQLRLATWVAASANDSSLSRLVLECEGRVAEIRGDYRRAAAAHASCLSRQRFTNTSDYVGATIRRLICTYCGVDWDQRVRRVPGHASSWTPQSVGLKTVARLAGAETSLRNLHQRPLNPKERLLLNAAFDRARQILGASAFRMEFRSGQSLSQEDAARLAQSLAA